MTDPSPPPAVPPAPPALAASRRAPAWTAGRALALTASLVRRGAVPLLGAALLVQLPVLLLAWTGGEDGGYYLAASNLAGFVQAGLAMAGALQLLRGERPRLGRMFGAVGSRLFPLLLQSALGGLAVLLGLALLVVPGLVVWAGLAVSAPAVLAEPALTTNEALQRSWDLTRGRRLQVFLTVLALFLAVVGVAYAASALRDALPFAAGPAGTLLTELVPLPFQVAAAAGAAVLYHLLREELEGAPAARLAAVFE